MWPLCRKMTDKPCYERTKPCKKSIRWGCIFYNLISSILLSNGPLSCAARVPLLVFLASGHVSKVLPEHFMATYILRSFKAPLLIFLQLCVQSGTLRHQMLPGTWCNRKDGQTKWTGTMGS